MATVDPEDIPATVDTLLQQDSGQTAAIVPLITTMAKAYTRGRGFVANWPNDEIAAVIATASARLASNPSQLSRSSVAGPFTEDVRTFFNGWTLAELYVLNRYRARAM